MNNKQASNEKKHQVFESLNIDYEEYIKWCEDHGYNPSYKESKELFFKEILNK